MYKDTEKTLGPQAKRIRLASTYRNNTQSKSRKPFLRNLREKVKKILWPSSCPSTIKAIKIREQAGTRRILIRVAFWRILITFLNPGSASESHAQKMIWATTFSVLPKTLN